MAGSESNRQEEYAVLLVRPYIIFIRHPTEDGKIIPLH